MIMGELKDKRAIGILVEMIYKEFHNSKIFTDDNVIALDYHLIRDCIDAIRLCGYTKDEVNVLAPFADKLRWYKRVDESLIEEIADLVGYAKPKETIMEKKVSDRRYTTIKNKVTHFEKQRQSQIAKGLDDTTVTSSPDNKTFSVKKEAPDDIPEGFVVRDTPSAPSRGGLIAAAVTVLIIIIAIIGVLYMAGTNSNSAADVTPTPKVTQVLNVIVTQNPTFQYYDVGGRVLTKSGQGIAGATVVIGRQSVVTDNSGYYKVSGVPSGNSWVIVWNPEATGMIFEKTIRISGSTNSLNLLEGTFGS
jgi:hypothetical protein